MSSRAETRAALTLVELLIAIPLSIAVIAAATAAFSVTAKVVAQCGRMSRNNAAVREAYLATVDEVDFWWSIDDPYDPARRPQRSTNGGTGDAGTGNPFVPMTLPPEYWNWDVADPRTWQRTGCWRNAPNGMDFSVISRLDDPDPTVAWSHQVIDRTLNCMGPYGLAEYLPPTTYWWYLTGTSGQNVFSEPLTAQYSLRHGSYPRKLNSTMQSPFQYNNVAGGRYIAMHHRVMGVAPRVGWRAGTNDRCSEIAQTISDAMGAQQVLDYSSMTPDLKLRAPGWPIIHGGLTRLEKQSGRGPRLDIQVIDEDSGDRVSYLFLFCGTTLRGARQQRDWGQPLAARLDQ